LSVKRELFAFAVYGACHCRGFNIDVEPLRGTVHPGEVFPAVIKFSLTLLLEEKLSDELKSMVDKLWD
jgi:hypothetical protein